MLPNLISASTGRRLITICLISSFVFLLMVFSHHHKQYSSVERRLEQIRDTAKKLRKSSSELLQSLNATELALRNYHHENGAKEFSLFQHQVADLGTHIDKFTKLEISSFSAMGESLSWMSLTEYNEALIQLGINYQQLNKSSQEPQKKQQLHATEMQRVFEDLRSNITRIQHFRNEGIRSEGKAIFVLYQLSYQQLDKQVTRALPLIAFMLLATFYYHRRTSSIEKRLMTEKEYATKIADEKTNILANVSHEVRTPVNSLAGILELLKSRKTLRLIDEDMLQTIDQEIRAINNTLTDILELSKLEAGKSSMTYEFFPLHKLLRESISTHRAQALAKGLRFNESFDFDPQTFICSNSSGIKQILSNLISNAVKYSYIGVITVSAQLNERSGMHTLKISVTDQGIGMSDEQQKHVFEKYYMADRNKGKEGYGLGLYIVSRTCKQLGGKVSCRSTLGFGTTFSIELPVRDLFISAGQTKPEEASEIPDDFHIVMVDDNPITLMMGQRLFKGKNAHFFNDSELAWSYIQSHDVQLVITDMCMPGLDGEDLLELIRIHPKTKHIQVLLSSAEPILTMTPSSRYAFDGILPKPIQLLHIRRALTVSSANQLPNEPHHKRKADQHS